MVKTMLREVGIGFLDGSGSATVKVGPLSAREVWYPANAAISANQNAVNEAECRIYVGNDTSQPYFRDGSVSGSFGDSTDKVAGKAVKQGEYVWAVWTGGDPGAQAMLTVTGEKDV